MRSWAVMLGLAVLLLFLMHPPATIPDVKLLPVRGGEGGCFEVSRCIQVYAAPWCPSCKQAVPIVNGLYRRALASGGAFGVEVVVGQDDEQELRRFATRFHSPVSMDMDGAFYRGLGSPGVPAWQLSDAEGSILKRFSGTPTGPPVDQIVTYLIRERFGLKEGS